MTAAPDRSATWTKTTHFSRTAAVTMAAALVIALGASVYSITLSAVAGTVVLVLVVIVSFFAISMARWRVTADSRGLTVRSMFGIPSISVPLSDMTAAKTVDVEPTVDFGGWGLRFAKGRSGVITMGGEAIEVTRTSGKRFVVTVDKAPAGAALLSQLIAQRPAVTG